MPRHRRASAAVRWAEEKPRLRPLKVQPEDLALRIPVYVGPTGTWPRRPRILDAAGGDHGMPGHCTCMGSECASSPVVMKRCIPGNSWRTKGLR